MSNREQAIEAGTRAILGQDEPCARWGIKCVTHTTNYLSANFSNQSEEKCDRVHQARSQSTAVVDAVTPILRPDPPIVLMMAEEVNSRDDAEQDAVAAFRERLRAQVEALPTAVATEAWVRQADVLALLEGSPVSECVIVGPYYPVGEVDWRCLTHQVDAVLRDPARYGGRDHRREEFRCPVGEPSWKVALRDNEAEVRERLRAQVEALLPVRLGPEHARYIHGYTDGVRAALDVLALLDGEP